MIIYDLVLASMTIYNDTPMVTNLKKLTETASDSDLVDPMMYRQLIGSLMYLVNTRPGICFPVSALS